MSRVAFDKYEARRGILISGGSSGTPGAGKVLTALDTAGNAQWADDYTSWVKAASASSAEADSRLSTVSLNILRLNWSTSTTYITFDGVQCVVGDKVLIKDLIASRPDYNGVYVINGFSSNICTLTRVPEADSMAALANLKVLVQQGVLWANTQWVCATKTGTINTFGTPLSFAAVNATVGIRVARFNFTGNGSTTLYTCTHNFNTYFPIVQTYVYRSPWGVYFGPDTPDYIAVLFDTPPVVGAPIDVVVMG